MQRRTQHLSHLVAMSLTAAFLLCCVFVFRIKPSGVLGLAGWRVGDLPITVSCVAVALLGMALLVWTNRQIRKGIRTDRWTAAEIDRWREIAEHPAVQTVSWILLITALLLVSFSSSRNRFTGGYWNCFILMQSISSLRDAFKRPTPVRSSPSLGPIKPLHSEHWGE